jgi:hypothetical protein
VTGDLLTPLLGGADNSDAHLGAVLDFGVSQDATSASGHIDVGSALAGIADPLDQVVDMTGILEHLHA